MSEARAYDRYEAMRSAARRAWAHALGVRVGTWWLVIVGRRVSASRRNGRVHAFENRWHCTASRGIT